MALILPAKADGFARAAEVTRQGFMAARELAADHPVVQMLETDGTAAGALAAYQEALDRNVAVIVGPLTKTEVAAVMKEQIKVPTLMLNTPDGAFDTPRGLYLLSLSTELEARAAAEAGYRPEAGNAVIVTTASPLSKRASAAFLDAWSRLGGVVKEVIEYSGNMAKIKHGVDKARPDLVFLAADAERARLIKPFLGRNTQVIATSQVYSGTLKPDGSSVARADLPKIPDLNGLRFIDMPWLHQPDHAAAMVFPRPDPPLSADLERLYALGIDAFRVAEQLTRERGEFEIDGVTGRLQVKAGLIERTPIQAEYRDGLPVPFNGAVLAHDGARAPSGAH
jgi:outer membrane PBP1 activator LpoA protein